MRLRDLFESEEDTCGSATLRAFGITTPGATKWANVQTLLKKAGHKLSPEVPAWGTNKPTLSSFIKNHKNGDFVIFTSDHIMALRDGKLTDTDETRGGRRKVIEAYKVSK